MLKQWNNSMYEYHGQDPSSYPWKKVTSPLKMRICTHNYPYFWTLRGSGSANKTSMGWQRVSLHVPKQNRTLHQLNGLSILMLKQPTFLLQPYSKSTLDVEYEYARSLPQGHPGMSILFPYVLRINHQKTRQRLARERKRRFSSSSEYGSRKKLVGEFYMSYGGVSCEK